jgi:arginase family enzyme
MISLIGAPCDAGANWPGACQGPGAPRTLGLREVMTRALAGLDANTHLHLSFDVDFPGLESPRV